MCLLRIENSRFWNNRIFNLAMYKAILQELNLKPLIYVAKKAKLFLPSKPLYTYTCKNLNPQSNILHLW